jgi:hypothetical protein
MPRLGFAIVSKWRQPERDSGQVRPILRDWQPPSMPWLNYFVLPWQNFQLQFVLLTVKGLPRYEALQQSLAALLDLLDRVLDAQQSS